MKFGNHLDASMVPEWQTYYIQYKKLKKKLKQAEAEAATAVDFLAASPQTASLSIARSLATGSPRHLSTVRPQQLQGTSNAGSAVEQQQQQEQPVFFTAYGLAPSCTAQEQFLQMLQQDLARVRDFIDAQAATLSASLEALAAAAPQLAVQSTEALEAEAQGLGQKLLALEQFVNINQTGFVKIVKKHDKVLPDIPVWHLYLHHLQKTPWLQEHQRQFMWAALSSCYYHLHASILASRRRRSRQQQQQQQRDSRLQLSSRTASIAAAAASSDSDCSSLLRSSMDTAARTPSRFLPSAFRAAVAGAASAAVAGAASAVAGAATAVAGAATAVAGAAAAAASSRPAADAAAAAGQRGSGPPALKVTMKFWVAQEDVSAVMYKILQHLPLLPSAVHSSNNKDQQQQGSFATRQPATAASPWQQQQQRHQQIQAFAGFTTTLHTVYFDNKGLELYHGRLYFRPNTQTIKARWIGKDDEFWAPAKVVLERKVYCEGWKGEKNIKDALLIAGEVLPSYLVGTYSLGDALSQLHELPALQQTLRQTLESLQQRRRQRQVAQQKQLQLLQQSPFAAANAAVEAAAGAADGGAGHAGSNSGIVNADSAAAADGEVNAALAAAGVRVPPGVVLGSSMSSSFGGILAKSYGSQPDMLALQQQQQQEEELGLETEQQQLQCFSDMPRPSQWQGQQLGRGLLPSLQEQQQQQVLSIPGLNSSTTAAPSVDSVADSSDDSGSDDDEPQCNGSNTTGRGRQQQQRQSGGVMAAATANGSNSMTADPFADDFEDAYLQPPMPSADQLALFTEVQKLVALKRLQPVLHCTVHRMLFAMPFDDSIKITLDTDATMAAVAHHQLQQDPVQAAVAPAAARAAPSASQPAVLAAGQLSAALQEAAAAVVADKHPFAGQPGSESCIKDSLMKPSLLSIQLQEHLQLQQQQQQGSNSVGAAGGGVLNLPFNPAILEQEDSAYDTWEAIYSNETGSNHHSTAGHGSSGLTYGMPYALLKVSVDLPAGQNPPGWLLQLMESELLSPVEDWSKFVHGCAVLLPEAVRAVPYWIDDPLVDLSVQAIQAELDAAITQLEEQMKLAAVAAAPARSSSAGSHLQQQHSVGRSSLGQLSGVLARSSSGGVSTGTSRGLLSPESNSGVSSQQSSAGGTFPQQQQQQQLFRQRSSRINRLRHSSSAGGLQQPDEHDQHHDTAATAGAVSNSLTPPSQHRVTWAGDSPSHRRDLLRSSAGGSSSNLEQPLYEPATPLAAAGSQKLDQEQLKFGSEASTPRASVASSTAAADVVLGGGRQLVRRLSNLLNRREKPPPLFRPEGYLQGLKRKRWGHPVQLMECTEFFHSEAVFLEWLRLAITMASVAVLLLGYSAMAYVNPLKKPLVHVAEIITLLLLPTSCIIVAYAIRVYTWRGKRLHSMRYRRVDDQVGPNLMAAVFVTAMVAIFLVNMADLLLILKHGSTQQGDDPDPGDEPELKWLLAQPRTLLGQLL